MNFNKDFDVVGLGVSTVDILHLVEHFPSIEEVQKSLGNKIDGGGPIATAIIALSRLGAKTAMLDSIGDDWVGNKIIEGFKKENVNIDAVKINKDTTSSTASVIVRKSDGARTIVYSPGSAPELTEAGVPEELIADSKYLHINGRHFSACKKAVAYAKKHNTKISFDGGTNRYRDELKEIIPLTDICIITKDFAAKYTGEKNITDAAGKFLQYGISLIVITDGLNGSFLFSQDIEGFHQKAFNIENVVDTTGCGDCYHGAFLYGLCANKNLYDTIYFASAAAALNTQKLGGRAGLPTLNQVENFILSHEL